jgi:hypothetical protein
MRFLPCGLVLLAGCAQLFGLDDTKAASGASLQLQRVSIGSSVVTSPLDLSSQMATFWVPATGDPSILVATPAVQSATDTWTADVQGVPFDLFTLPDLPKPLQHLWELPVANVKGAFNVFEHPNPTPPPANATEMLSVTLPSAAAVGESYYVEVIGAWTYHALAGAEIPVPPAMTISTSVPYASFAPMTPSPPARIAAEDTVVVLRFTGATLSGVYQTAFDQSDTMDAISGTMVAVTADQKVQAPIDPNALATRYTAARPAVASLALSWVVSAAPGASVGAATGTQLAAGGIMMTDTMVLGLYGNPFESLGWPALFTVSSSESRTFMFNGMPITLGANTRLVADAASTTMVDFAAPMPEQVDLDDNQLTVDGQSVTLDPSMPHTIKMLTENRPASVYALDLVELSATMPGGQSSETTVLHSLSSQPTFTIPPSILQSGHTYIPVVTTVASDYSGAASGDLTVRTLPAASATFTGGVFTVGP